MKRIKSVIRNTIGYVLRKITMKDPTQILEDLSKKGAHIGKNVLLFSSEGGWIDDTRPWLLTIGDYTKIAKGVTILTHDYSLAVLRRAYGEWIGEGRQTIIGSNVFLGMGSMVLMGSKIGNNSIVGAGSVVSGHFPDNVVIAGNPARVIRSLESYYKRRKEMTRVEAVTTAKAFIDTYHRDPSPYDMREFYPLFSPRDLRWMSVNNISLHPSGDV